MHTWFVCKKHGPVCKVDIVAGNYVLNFNKIEEHRSKFKCKDEFVFEELRP
jgi:hypothetical protein